MRLLVLFITLTMFNTNSFSSILFRVKIKNERVTLQEWNNLKKSLEIDFRIPANIDPIRLSNIERFKINYDFESDETVIDFLPNLEFLKRVPSSFFEVILIDKLGEYSDSNRKRFNLLADGIIEFTIRRVAYRTKLEILNPNVSKLSIEYDGQLLSSKNPIISSTPNSSSIKRLRILSNGYVPWDQYVFEGKIIQERRLLILLIPNDIYNRYEKAVYLFQLGLLKEAESEFLKLRIDFPQWGYPYYYPVLIHYIQNGTFNEQDIIDLQQSFEFASYENNFLLMAEVKYLFTKYYLETRKYHLATKESELIRNYLNKEIELFKEGRFSFYFVNIDLLKKAELLNIMSEIYDFYYSPFYGDLTLKKNELLKRLFNVSEKLKKIIWTDEGAYYLNIYNEEITKLRTLVKSKK